MKATPMMKNPVHPGQIVRYECLEALGLNVSEAASILGVARPTLSRVLNGRGAVSPEMAIRLSKAFGGTAEIWLRMQMAYDLAHLSAAAHRIDVKPYRKGADRECASGEVHLQSGVPSRDDSTGGASGPVWEITPCLEAAPSIYAGMPSSMISAAAV